MGTPRPGGNLAAMRDRDGAVVAEIEAATATAAAAAATATAAAEVAVAAAAANTAGFSTARATTARATTARATTARATTARATTARATTARATTARATTARATASATTARATTARATASANPADAAAVDGVASADAAAAVASANGGAEDDLGDEPDSADDLLVTRLDSFGPPTFDNVVSKLTIETASSHEFISPLEAGKVVRVADALPFAMTPAAVAVFSSRGSRGRSGSYSRRGSGATECTSPDSPPGGAVGEVRATVFHATGSGGVGGGGGGGGGVGARPIPLMTGLHLGGAAQEPPRGPSGFEELWAVLEPGWGINSSFGTSMTPKVMLLSEIYEKLHGFRAAVARVCVRACGPVLGDVCRRCARAWAVLTTASLQSVAESPGLRKIAESLGQLINGVERYEASAVVRRFTLPLIGAETAWEELLTAGEGCDLREPCQQIEAAIALLPTDGGHGGSGGGNGGGGGGGRQELGAGGNGAGGRRGPGSGELRLPPCPSYWAKGQFDLLTPNGLADVLTLLHEPGRFAELAQVVTRSSDDGPAKREYSSAWDCVRQVEGPALGRELRRALAATLVAAGGHLPLPRVPPPPPAYLARGRLTEQIEATILHPFLPLGIAGIGGASGWGKTVLASAVVRDETMRYRFGDRVFWLHAGKGARTRLVSLLQTLADTVYAWLTEGEHGSMRGGRGRGSSSGGGGGGGGRAVGDASGRSCGPSVREPVRFRDQDQAVNYVAGLCRVPLLAGLRCLVVLDDVHEREVVDALWKSGCQLLVTSPVEGLLQAVGAEVTMAEPLEIEAATQVAAGAAEEVTLCPEADRLVRLCSGCPLALAMSGAITQAALGAGIETREWRKPSLVTPVATGGQHAGGGVEGGSGTGLIGGGWSLDIGNKFSNLAAPVGAWVEQVVVGTSSGPSRQQQAGEAPSEQKGRPAAGRAGDVEMADHYADGPAPAPPRLSLEAAVWADLAHRVDSALASLALNRTLKEMLVDAGPEHELPVRELVAVLTEVALQEADRILGGSGWAVECYLSFGLLPEGLPLPPPALEEFWRIDGDSNDVGMGGGNKGGDSDFTEAQRCASAPLEIFEALRLVGRTGGGEGANGLIPHGLQRIVITCMSQSHPDTMAKMLRRRVRIISRICSLVGTFDDGCWALGGGPGEARARTAAAASRSGSGGGNGGAVGGKRGGSNFRRGSEGEGGGEEGGDDGVPAIPARLLGSGRPGPPSHGYGGFSRYDLLVASWDALPAAHTLTAAADGYISSVRAACKVAGQDGGGGGWAVARALASAADLLALSGRGAEAIPVYEEACVLLAEEAAREAKVAAVPQRQQTARNSLHKVASMVKELALLAAQFGKEAPAIRLLQRAVEMHLSALEACGVLVPHPDGGDCGGGGGGRSGCEGADSEGSKLGRSGGSAEEMAADEEARGRGGSITCRAVADDSRPLRSRLWLQPSAGTGAPSPSGRGSSGGGGGSGGSGTLPAFGRLDVVGTCVGDLGLVLACTRQLRQEKKVEESVQLAEKVYPVLKEIVGADHAFTKAALAAFVGQGIVDECWSQSDVDGGTFGPALPSPTSRRRLARSYEGRGGTSAGEGSASADKGGYSVTASTLSDLSSPPSPLPEEFYARHATSFGTVQGQTRGAPMRPRGGELGAGGLVWRPDRGGGDGGDGGDRGRSCSRFSHNDSTSSGTEGDDGEDSDNGLRIDSRGPTRRAGPVGLGNSNSYAYPRRSLDRLSHGSGGARSGGAQQQGWYRDVGAVGSGLRGALEPASTRMQQDFYFRHRTRRARAHAFLITAGTRARLKDAIRAEAGLFLADVARQSKANSNGGSEGAGGGLMSPDGTAQMARLTALTRR